MIELLKLRIIRFLWLASPTEVCETWRLVRIRHRTRCIFPTSSDEALITSVANFRSVSERRDRGQTLYLLHTNPNEVKLVPVQTVKWTSQDPPLTSRHELTTGGIAKRETDLAVCLNKRLVLSDNAPPD